MPHKAYLKAVKRWNANVEKIGNDHNKWISKLQKKGISHPYKIDQKSFEFLVTELLLIAPDKVSTLIEFLTNDKEYKGKIEDRLLQTLHRMEEFAMEAANVQ